VPSRSPEADLDAAVAILAVNPGASMQEVADAIGISRATLHRQFAGRDDLIAAIGEWAIGQFETILDAVEQSDLRGLAAVEAFLARAIKLVPKVGYLMSEYSIEGNEAFMGRVARNEERWCRMIEEAQRLGEIRIDLPARWIVEATQGLLLGVFHGIRHGMTAPNDALRLVRITLLEGIRTVPVPALLTPALLAPASPELALPTSLNPSLRRTP
jgi:TetR/AcrR family transcriptional regulator, mexCD-oprJ operon repressor